MKLGDIVNLFCHLMAKGKEKDALDALDETFFRQWPQLDELRVGEKNKLLSDVRGLAVEIFNWQYALDASKPAGRSERGAGFTAEQMGLSDVPLIR